MSQGRLLALEKETRAFRMRRDGNSLREIAEALGYANESGAYKAIQRAYKRTAKLNESEADFQRSLDLGRCDVAIVGLMPGVEAGKARSVEALMGVLKRRADLLGLDKPQKVASTNADGSDRDDGLSDAQLIAELARFAEAIRGREAEAAARSSPLPLDAQGSSEPEAT